MRKQKVQKEKRAQRKFCANFTGNMPQGRKIWTASIAAAFAAAVAVFGVMVKIEKDTLTKYEKGTVYTAFREIPKGQLITKENSETYFQKRDLDKSCIPDTALISPEQVQNLVAKITLEEGVLLTEGMFEPINEITGHLKEPVIAGLKADDLQQVAGGILRAGDRIHIYSIRQDGDVEKQPCVWKEVFVEQVFDSAGNAIENSDKKTAAQRINICLSAEDVEQFYTELAVGSLRAVKVCE